MNCEKRQALQPDTLTAACGFSHPTLLQMPMVAEYGKHLHLSLCVFLCLLDGALKGKWLELFCQHHRLILSIL